MTPASKSGNEERAIPRAPARASSIRRPPHRRAVAHEAVTPVVPYGDGSGTAEAAVGGRKSTLASIPRLEKAEP
jgi:hypothetical protein